MYTATMLYRFLPGKFEDACRLWEEEIFNHAKGQPGFVRMQLLTAPPVAMAIGTWKSSSYARRFMGTGVFKELMSKLDAMLTEAPEQAVWDLRHFAEG
ncbi:MAG TPA: hypothetical protein VMW69_04595 [Spirochaetia bacterium]|nr:hypothetical protein [Spirochaetia bacterium]